MMKSVYQYSVVVDDGSDTMCDTNDGTVIEQRPQYALDGRISSETTRE